MPGLCDPLGEAMIKLTSNHIYLKYFKNTQISISSHIARRDDVVQPSPPKEQKAIH
jgi:hypothetical protein